VSARHQVNGRIAVWKSSLFPNIGPAEETSFLRSVRLFGSAISPASSAQVKSGPDVFADALVPCAAARAGAFDFAKIPTAVC
jgi:hypothetical protein